MMSELLTDIGDMIITPTSPKEVIIEIFNVLEEMLDYANHVPTKAVWSQMKLKLNANVKEVIFVND